MTALMGLSKGEKKVMLGTIIAHAAGQLAHHGDSVSAAAVCRRVADKLAPYPPS